MLLLIPLLPFLGFLRQQLAGQAAAEVRVRRRRLPGDDRRVRGLGDGGARGARRAPSASCSRRSSAGSPRATCRSRSRFVVDPLSSLMILVITGIGSLIHIYSTATCTRRRDSEYARYFSYLNLFAAFMLVLVLGANFPVMFVGWEGVGLCSYLLIGFWFKKQSAADAGKKAFIVNRIGDFGFILGMLLLFVTLRHARLPGGRRGGRRLARSSRRAWARSRSRRCCSSSARPASRRRFRSTSGCPDAMEGPTPVSALIHAATMVTAGVYMIGRNAVLFRHAPIDAGGRRRRSASRRRSWPARSAWCRTTSSACSPTRPCRSSATCSWRWASARMRAGDLPSLHARLLQGAALPRLRRGDPRAGAASRTCATWAA